MQLARCGTSWLGLSLPELKGQAGSTGEDLLWALQPAGPPMYAWSGFEGGCMGVGVAQVVGWSVCVWCVLCGWVWVCGGVEVGLGKRAVPTFQPSAMSTRRTAVSTAPSPTPCSARLVPALSSRPLKISRSQESLKPALRCGGGGVGVGGGGVGVGGGGGRHAG